MMPNETDAAIARITRMEALFDLLQNALQEAPCPEWREAEKILLDYYTNGEWMHDYELDKAGKLPASLKRGVLSQDGIYNLICELDR